MTLSAHLSIEELMNYASKSDIVEKSLDINEMDSNGKYMHEEIRDKCPNFKDVDKILSTLSTPPRPCGVQLSTGTVSEHRPEMGSIAAYVPYGEDNPEL